MRVGCAVLCLRPLCVIQLLVMGNMCHSLAALLKDSSSILRHATEVLELCACTGICFAGDQNGGSPYQPRGSANMMICACYNAVAPPFLPSLDVICGVYRSMVRACSRNPPPGQAATDTDQASLLL